MNSKEKQELKKELLHSNLSNKTIVKIVKCLEAFEANEEEQCHGCMGPCGQCEHPQPLDAGEALFDWIEKNNLQNQETLLTTFQIKAFAESFAQASMIAREKEWEEREKQLKKVVRKMEMVYYGSQTHEILDNKISKLIIKLNNILTNE